MTDVLVKPSAYRQTLIASFDSCPRRALFALLDNRRTPGPFASSGSLFHRWAHEAVELMKANGQTTMPVEMGMELLSTVLEQRDVSDWEVLPITMKDMRWLRVLVAKWCQNTEISVDKIVSQERRLSAPITLPDGTERTITGQLDVLMADAPGSCVVLDWKSGFQRAPQPKDNEKAEDGRGLTPLGWVQSLVYSHLVFHAFPSIDRCEFREHHVRWGETRFAVTWRWEAERMTDVLATQISLLDQAIDGGIDSPRWTESAGPHCALCSRPRSCPIQESVGIPTNEDEARKLANEWIVAAQIRADRIPLLKGWVDQWGPIEITHAKGRRVVGWDESPDGKRSFGLYEPHTDV